MKDLKSPWESSPAFVLKGVMIPDGRVVFYPSIDQTKQPDSAGFWSFTDGNVAWSVK